MATDLLICPECGGIIGADETTDHGRPCTCFKDVNSDTSLLGKAVPTAKICCKCGKDVTGRKRLRDSLGYWCYDCHKADQARNKPQGVRCAECGRVVSETALMDFHGLKICIKCRDDNVMAAQHKKKFRAKVGDKAYADYDRKRLFMLLGVMAVLIILIVLSRMHVIGGPF